MKGFPVGFWAKLDTDDDGNVIHWHPLTAHCADVAAVFEALLNKTILNQRMAQLLNQDTLSKTQIARLSALAAIHDAGKVNHGFQNKAFKNQKPTAGHVSPIIEVLDEYEYQEKILIPLCVEEIITWFDEEKTAVDFLAATWAHHGKPVSSKSAFKPSLWFKNEIRNPIEGLNTLGQCMKLWFPDAFESNRQCFPDKPLIAHTYNGILTLADWLGSDPLIFRYTSKSVDDHEYIKTARRNAERAVTNMMLDTRPARRSIEKKPITFQMISSWDPYDIQKKCLELPIHQKGSLTILESDTGSGKTEAALARFLKLYQNSLVDGMYFAVPTRSAATQLYRRVHEAVKMVFSNEKIRPPVVQAVPGYLSVDSVEGKALPHFKVLWYEEDKDHLRERNWAGEHPKKYLAGSIVVGTIDQVLLATLQVKHVHMRAAALLRHFLVVDEVHSSDTYMTRLLERVLEIHLNAGGHAMLMSATLATASRYRFAMKQLPQPDSVISENTDYPLITHTDHKREVATEVHGHSTGSQKTVQTKIKNIGGDVREIVSLAFEKARQGARVLIIRNLIGDCIATQKALESYDKSSEDMLFQTDGIITPHHSRFAPDDRKKLDNSIEKSFGKTSNKKSVIAVTTQTVEQSLDIDSDYLITDLCPMDVLLQRIGRLHRHRRKRPTGFDSAHCTILTPKNRDLSTFITEGGRASKGKQGLGTVYQDLRIIEATWRVLEDESWHEWQIPSDNRKLIERSMHPSLLINIVEEKKDLWKIHQQFIDGQIFADLQFSGMVCMDFYKPFAQSGFNENLETIKTRLGRDDIHLTFEKPVKGPFGNQIKEITVAEWMTDKTSDEDTVIPSSSITRFAGGFTFTFSDRSFCYDRFGLTFNAD